MRIGADIRLLQVKSRRIMVGETARAGRNFVRWGRAQGWRSSRGVAFSRAVRSFSFLFAAMLAAAPAVAAAQTESEPPPEDAAPAETATESETAEEPPTTSTEPTPTEVAVRGLSWDILAGGVPSSGGLLQAELGFSALPRVAYHYTLMPDFSLGAVAALDYARWSPDAAFTTSLVVAAATRFSLYRDDEWSIGLRGEPGVRIGFDDPFVFGILVNLQGHVGYTVEPRLIVGGGIDVPLELGIPDKGKAFFIAPLLFGGFAEFHVTPPLALTIDVKFGPHLNTAGTTFGMRVLAGLAVRL